MTESTFNSTDEARVVDIPRETDLERSDAERMVAPAAGLAWIAMGLVAYFWPDHFGAGAAFAPEFAVGFTTVGMLVLIGSAGPQAVADRINRLAPWLLFIVLFAEVWLIGPTKATF